MSSVSDKQRPSNSEEPENRPRDFRAAGIPIGVGVGVALGVALDNIAVGIAIGVGIGIALGSAMGRTRQGLAWEATERQNGRLLIILGLGILGLLVGLGALLFYAAR
jgi:hypothetical protein